MVGVASIWDKMSDKWLWAWRGVRSRNYCDFVITFHETHLYLHRNLGVSRKHSVFAFKIFFAAFCVWTNVSSVLRKNLLLPLLFFLFFTLFDKESARPQWQRWPENTLTALLTTDSGIHWSYKRCYIIIKRAPRKLLWGEPPFNCRWAATV